VIIVTGAAGFIGSCVVAECNARGIEDILVVDHYDGPDDLKKRNLENKKYVQYCDKADFLNLVKTRQFAHSIECVIHMGACSSTTLNDEQYFQENNFEYTKTLAQWALEHNIRFIYASSAATYGDGSAGYKDDDATTRKCRPLNLYGWSKQNFDLWAMDNNVLDKIVGLKFFNVFGPNENHKGDMRSVVAKSYAQVVEEGKMRLFKSAHPDYGDGEQKRDFIYVKDAVDMVMFFVDHPNINGLFNVGTGKAQTWNELAEALFAAVGQKPNIEYFEMPDVLKERYQYFTQAEMSKIRKAGYTKECAPLKKAVADYATYLKSGTYL